ncbi:MAG: tetratricopeptide repeat protein [Acidiferrobacterales bacterium]
MATHSKLAVILHADVVGSTALVQKDERVAHERIQDSFRRLSETITAYGGVTHEVRGDALLPVFGRASHGVLATLAYQFAITEQNAVLTDDIRPEIRVGIALGEVVVADNTVTGAGVVLAQRIEQLAESGGLCISAAINEAVPRRLPVEFKSLGDQSVKGFDEPVRVYSVSLRAGEKVPEPDNDVYCDDSEAKSSTPMLAFPGRPSIAVLPFNNLSGDPDQEYFADGMTEDIITGLSRFRSLFVIARNSTFAYKGRSPDVREVVRDLGVRYVLEGSIRQRGNRIRVTGQLIDAASGNHIWAERYDRGLDDIFAVQDQITEAIVAAIEPHIGHRERERAQRKPPSSLDAWGLYQRGLAAYYTTTEDGLASAIEMFDRVNELDPHFQAAFAMAAESRVRYVMFYCADERAALLEQAREKAQQGVSLDPGDPLCLLADGRVNTLMGQFDLAISQFEEAIALNPSYAMAHYALGWVLFQAGRAEEAIPPLDIAIRLSPHDAFLSGFQHIRARALFALHRYQECIEWERRATRSPNAHFWAFVTFAAALFRLDREDEARDVVADLLRRAPHFSMSFMKASLSEEDPLDDAELIEAFRGAGVPE